MGQGEARRPFQTGQARKFSDIQLRPYFSPELVLQPTQFLDHPQVQTSPCARQADPHRALQFDAGGLVPCLVRRMNHGNVP